MGGFPRWYPQNMIDKKHVWFPSQNMPNPVRCRGHCRFKRPYSEEYTTRSSISLANDRTQVKMLQVCRSDHGLFIDDVLA